MTDARGVAQAARTRARIAAGVAERVATRRRRADLAVFHDFRPPPYGGGNQFMLALVGELERRGLRLERNRVSGRTPACLFNSYNFDFSRLRTFAREGCRFVHRVDGPIGEYRGADDGTDASIAALNRELADATVFQSAYSLDRHRALGLELVDPHVIHNTVDPHIFHPAGRAAFDRGRKLRVVSVSWSANPRKGGETYAWLASALDPARVEYTFVGRSSTPLGPARTLPPVPSAELAEILRSNDVFVAASLNDPCSNALLEALACGLPCVYADSGGHPELVGDAGLPFRDREEIPPLLEQLAGEYDDRRAAIRVRPLTEVADAYLAVLDDGDRRG